MPADSAHPHRDFWHRQARATRRRVNLGWWLETLAGPLVILSIAGAAALLWFRREMPAVETWKPAATTAAVLLIAGLACLIRAARRFESQSSSLVRIEAAMRLRNALSAAEAGVAPWPEPTAKTDAGLRWSWPRLIVPPIGALALLAAGLFIPVTPRQTTAADSPEQPQAWQQLSDELDLLAKEEVVDEPYLEETRKRLDELKSQKEEQWFSHSSLEATDSLKTAHRTETERVDRETGRAGNALDNMLQKGAKLTPDARERLLGDFDQALKGLNGGAMKPNPQLLEQMRAMDLKNLADLTPEQIEQLRKNLQKHGDAMKKCQGGDCNGEGEDWTDELLADEGRDGKEGAGRGGVNRGPGHSPGVLGAAKDPLETGDLTGLDAEDLSRSAPGDLLELQNGEHEADQTASATTEGGAIQQTGRGGDRVWRDALDPDEQRVMKRFFE